MREMNVLKGKRYPEIITKRHRQKNEVFQNYHGLIHRQSLLHKYQHSISDRATFHLNGTVNKHRTLNIRSQKIRSG